MLCTACHRKYYQSVCLKIIHERVKLLSILICDGKKAKIHHLNTELKTPNKFFSKLIPTIRTYNYPALNIVQTVLNLSIYRGVINIKFDFGLF